MSLIRDRKVGVMRDHLRQYAPILAYKKPEAAALVTCPHCLSTVRADKRKYWDYDGEAWVEHPHALGQIGYEVAGDTMADGSERQGKKRHR